MLYARDAVPGFNITGFQPVSRIQEVSEKSLFSFNSKHIKTVNT